MLLLLPAVFVLLQSAPADGATSEHGHSHTSRQASQAHFDSSSLVVSPPMPLIVMCCPCHCSVLLVFNGFRMSSCATYLCRSLPGMRMLLEALFSITFEFFIRLHGAHSVHLIFGTRSGSCGVAFLFEVSYSTCAESVLLTNVHSASVLVCVGGEQHRSTTVLRMSSPGCQAFFLFLAPACVACVLPFCF